MEYDCSNYYSMWWILDWNFEQLDYDLIRNDVQQYTTIQIDQKNRQG